jgi:hypothetical protein
MRDMSAAYDDAARRIAIAIRNMYEVGHRCACPSFCCGLTTALHAQLWRMLAMSSPCRVRV